MKKFIYCYSSNPFSLKEKSFYKIRRTVPSISEGITIKVRENTYSIQSQSLHIRDHYDLEYYLNSLIIYILEITMILNII